ncbi:MAG TPA: hypothetical protein VE032_03140 [Actinomycetota bacterium]|nr:hypothetical protein [Actinomycetota bacterium]
MAERTIPTDIGYGRAPSPPTAEAAALEYWSNRISFGSFAPRPPIERWRPDQRERFEAELRRLERHGPGTAP